MRLAVHTLDKAPKIDGAEVVSADYGDPDSLAEALGSIQQRRTARGVQGRWISPGTQSSVVFRGRSPGSGG